MPSAALRRSVEPSLVWPAFVSRGLSVGVSPELLALPRLPRGNALDSSWGVRFAARLPAYLFVLRRAFFLRQFCNKTEESMRHSPEKELLKVWPASAAAAAADTELSSRRKIT